MSAAAPLWAVPAHVRAESPPFTLADAIGLRVPLCFVVEPDPLWADRAVEALLEAYAAGREAEEGAPEVTVARWTRTRRWTSYRATYGFGLTGSDEPPARVDVLEEVLRLGEHLASARRGDGPHPLEGALFSVRGLQTELQRPFAAEVLLDVVRQLLACQGTLLVELDADPKGSAPASVTSLGPVFRLPQTPRLRYESAIAEVRAAARALGAAEPDAQAVAEALKGLTRLQAEVAARMTRAESELARGGADVLELLEASRGRVAAVLAGAGE
ncbi:MAG TPA: hypothetical protein VFR81_00715 [Longimicrobium sp.]|nr:hypothetical protein [Longimicrobium sp.]